MLFETRVPLPLPVAFTLGTWLGAALATGAGALLSTFESGGASSFMQTFSRIFVHFPLVPAWLCFKCWRKWSAR